MATMADGRAESGAEVPDRDTERRAFLKKASTAAMVAGLAGGYGGFAAIAGRYLYPAKSDDVMWQFVQETGRTGARRAKPS